MACDGVYLVATEDVDLAVAHNLTHLWFALLLRFWSYRHRSGNWFLEGEVNITLISQTTNPGIVDNEISAVAFEFVTCIGYLR